MCHKAIHGLRFALLVKQGSLFDNGDTGLDSTPQWEAYLAERAKDRLPKSFARPGDPPPRVETNPEPTAC